MDWANPFDLPVLLTILCRARKLARLVAMRPSWLTAAAEDRVTSASFCATVTASTAAAAPTTVAGAPTSTASFSISSCSALPCWCGSWCCSYRQRQIHHTKVYFDHQEICTALEDVYGLTEATCISFGVIIHYRVVLLAAQPWEMSDHFPENYRSRPRRKFHQQSLAKNVLNRTCAWAMPIGQSLMMYRNSSKFIFPSLSYTHRHQTLSITRAQWMYWVAHLVAFSNHIPASIQQNSGPSTSCVREIGWDYRSHRASSIVSTSPTCVLHRLSVGYRTAERITAYQQFDFKPTNSSQYRAHHPDEVLSRDVACT